MTSVVRGDVVRSGLVRSAVVRGGIAAIALTILIGPAVAQNAPRIDPGKGAVAPAAQLQLTQEQKVAIAGAVRPSEAKVKAPGNVPAVVGAEVPPATELYFLPDDALASVPEAKGVKYTVAQNRVVLVDPTRMRVVEVLPP